MIAGWWALRMTAWWQGVQGAATWLAEIAKVRAEQFFAETRFLRMCEDCRTGRRMAV